MSDRRDDETEGQPDPLPMEESAPAPEQPSKPEAEPTPEPQGFALRREGPIQRQAPQDWPGAVPLPPPPPVEPLPPLPPPPLPPLEPLATEPLPAKPRKKRRSLGVRVLLWVLKAIGIFLIGSVLWVLALRFVAPPVTLTMIGDLFGGHSITKHWMPLSRIDPDMPRAAIAAEDSGFCSHSGFDFAAIEAAFKRNQQGKRIRGGSTISQQTAKNVFLWQGGGYFRKGLEAYFTFLIENLWGKRRIMEVYLNVAETGIGTYGVNAGSIRYFGHDASAMSPREAAQIAAVLPLPKKRAGIDPRGFTRRYGNSITARIGVVRGDGLDACIR